MDQITKFVCLNISFASVHLQKLKEQSEQKFKFKKLLFKIKS